MENPKIRFKGFTKDWEQRKLGDLVNRITMEKSILSFRVATYNIRHIYGAY